MRQFTYFFFLSLFFFACSSDPCEEIVCVNGDCNDGSCACEEGWTGELCDQRDYNFIGSYRLHLLRYTDCQDGGGDFNIEGDNIKICNDPGDPLVPKTCVLSVIEINADNTFEVSFAYERVLAGRVIETTGTDNDYSGTYTISGNEVNLCGDSFCEKYEFGDDLDLLLLYDDNRSDPACLDIYEYKRE